MKNNITFLALKISLPIICLFLLQYLLELLHVEELHGPLHLEGAVRHLEDVVGDGAALVVERVLEK